MKVSRLLEILSVRSDFAPTTAVLNNFSTPHRIVSKEKESLLLKVFLLTKKMFRVSFLILAIIPAAFNQVKGKEKSSKESSTVNDQKTRFSVGLGKQSRVQFAANPFMLNLMTSQFALCSKSLIQFRSSPKRLTILFYFFVYTSQHRSQHTICGNQINLKLRTRWKAKNDTQQSFHHVPTE